MLSVISAASGYNIDSEYLRIIGEMRRLGLTPSGDKNTDTARLTQAKTELVSKIQNKESAQNTQNIGVQVIEPVDESEYAVRAEMEEQRLGAMSVAQLNRLYFGL